MAVKNVYVSTNKIILYRIQEMENEKNKQVSLLKEKDGDVTILKTQIQSLVCKYIIFSKFERKQYLHRTACSNVPLIFILGSWYCLKDGGMGGADRVQSSCDARGD